MRIKTKVRIGVFFLFIVILTIAGLGLYYLRELSQDSENILKNNYETLEFTKRIIESSDSLKRDSARAMKVIEVNLQGQEENLTEVGERELTHDLRIAFERIKNNNGSTYSDIIRIRQLSLAIQELNMQAIIKKNELTQTTAKNASNILIIIGTLFALSAFTFIINFPSYIADPVVRLTNSIKLIANKNYEERLHFDRKDEFEELAEAFNQMAEKLDEYEHSNLAMVLFEKKRIETIINRMSDPIIGLDENNKVVFANDQAFALLNLTPQNVIGGYAPDIALQNDLFRNLIRKENSESTGLIKAVISGKENYFSKESIVIQYKPTGEKETVMIGQVILLKNITSYKELDLAKTNFIATISHELKTPIASVQMCIKLLQDVRVGSLNMEQTNILKTLSDETLRLSKITNELLDLSQVETGNIKLDIQKTEPGEIVNLALAAVKFQAERKHVEINIQLPIHLPYVQADVNKSTWVLVNFLTNSIRYTPENGKLNLRCYEYNGSVFFSVEDFGPGIETKYINRIFEKFFQVPGSKSGTGLGLAISKEFIEAQGGSISVESEFGKGSVFSFALVKANV